MMRIAVIGASGFVGSTLVERLLAQARHEVLPLVSLTMGSVDDNREHPVYSTGVTDRCSSDP